MTLDNSTASPSDPVSALLERQFRESLWINHGCPFSALYGDDGEMQCNANDCRIDFKKMPLAELCVLLMARRRLHAGKCHQWTVVRPTHGAHADLALLAKEMRVLDDALDRRQADNNLKALSEAWKDARPYPPEERVFEPAVDAREVAAKLAVGCLTLLARLAEIESHRRSICPVCKHEFDEPEYWQAKL
jgi:hypothetical protein